MRPSIGFAIALLLCALPFAAQEAPPPSAEQVLMEAAFNGDLEEVQRLVSAGAVVVDVGAPLSHAFIFGFVSEDN